MNLIPTILIIIVALLHFYFLYIEMFLWDKPFGMKTFRMTAFQRAQEVKSTPTAGNMTCTAHLPPLESTRGMATTLAANT